MFRPAPLIALLALAACVPGLPPAVDRLEERPQIDSHAGSPPEAAPEGCWARDETPARLETITEEVVVADPTLGPDGKVLVPAGTRTETRQEIVEKRRELWFQTPCPDSFTPDVVASLQRALQARGLYGGAITGALDTETRSAIRRYQEPQGLDSAVLSLAAARQLGLVAVETPE